MDTSPVTISAPEARELMVTEQTIQAVGHRRNEIADVRCVTPNAIAQIIAGNNKDPYAAFKDWSHHVGMGGGNVGIYLLNLQAGWNRTIDIDALGTDSIWSFLGKQKALLAELERKLMNYEEPRLKEVA